jgi:CRISPR-associated endonuclease/helicase Cas3
MTRKIGAWIEKECGMTPLAHSDQGSGGHDLAQHLRCTAKGAATFASAFGAAAWGELTGRWHDLGKFSPDFQDYLSRAGDDAAHAAESAPSVRVDHSTAGAIHARDKLRAAGQLLAYAIAGHHAGLPDWESIELGRGGLKQRLRNRSLLDAVLQTHPPDELLAPIQLPGLDRDIDLSLFVRMVFSALIDADRLDTEAFMDPDQSLARKRPQPPAVLVEQLDRYLQALMEAAPATPVNQRRRDLLTNCVSAASQPSGLFSLTAPTGLGKTLSGLAFALHHAVAHDKSRVIYVAPYTSIIEQTADAFRAALGTTAVLEHHSNLDPANEAAATRWHRLAAENWDASVIVTTAVQFFESLFTAHPGRSRKLHRIANAVVFLDEAQMLPPDFLLPILRYLEELMRRYGTSVVLATATQPALDPRPTARPSFPGLLGPGGRREIVADPAALHAAMRRVRVTLPPSLDVPITWETLAVELDACPSVLCIVDKRQDARELHALMPAGTRHLSGLMCGAHRAEVLRDIRTRLARGDALRVISTQIVEAGVDLDFPAVFRALAGLDSLAQAAGRCNREGRLAHGDLCVFIPPKPPPPGHLRQAADVARLLLRQNPADPFTPEMFRMFFEQLYWLKGDHLDAEQIGRLLPKQPSDGGFAFRAAGDKFRLIPDDQASILVPYGADGEALIAAFHSSRNTDMPRRELYRRAQRLTVGLPRRVIPGLETQGILARLDVDLLAAAPWAYHPDYGLDITALLPPDTLVV